MNDMTFFLPIKNLICLEAQNAWDKAIALTYDVWKSDRSSADKLCRLIGECWIFLTANYLTIDESSRTMAKRYLLGATECGLNDCSCSINLKFMTLCGYCISMFPDLFCKDPLNDEEYVFWQKKGLDLLMQAHNNHNDTLSKVLYLGATGGASKDYKDAHNAIQPLLHSYFPGKSAIEQYFVEVLENVKLSSVVTHPESQP